LQPPEECGTTAWNIDQRQLSETILFGTTPAGIERDTNRMSASPSWALGDEVLVSPPIRPRGADLFRTLSDADWVGSVGSKDDCSGNIPCRPNEATCPKVTHIGRQVQRRHALLNLYQAFERMAQSYNTGISQYDNAILFVTDWLSVHCTEQSRRPPEEECLAFLKDSWDRLGGDFNFYGITVREFVLKSIREAGRWQELNDKIGAAVLLLSDCDGDDEADILNFPAKEMHDMTLIENGLPDNFRAVDIATIIQHGANEDFAKMIMLLSNPELQLKEICQRLGGLVDLICRLTENDQHNIQTKISYHTLPLALERASARRILARTVQDQVSEVLGELLVNPSNRSDKEDYTADSSDGDVGIDEGGFTGNYCELGGLDFESISFPCS
jgi:hypothetical protein